MPHAQFRTCCERQDGSKYKHPCACPAIQLITKSLEKTSTLCGFSEFTGFASTPPKKYLTSTLAGSESYDTTSFVASCSPPVVDVSVTASGAGSVSYNSSTCEKTGTFQRNHLAAWSCVGPGGSATFTISDCEIPDSQWPKIFTVNSSDTCGNSAFKGTRTGGSSTSATVQTITTTHGSYTKTLSLEDTEVNALARATATEGTSTFSLYQTRSTGFTFIKRTVDYAVLCTGLVAGKSYNGAIPKQSRTAVIGTTGTWEIEASDTFTFTATKKFHIEGGTLNASITDEDFIAQGYTLDPLDYGLDAAEDVITPETELDHTQGYEYQIGTNPELDPLYVEAD